MDHVSTAVVFSIDGFGFPKFDGMQLAGMAFKSLVQPLPDQDNKIFGGWLHAFRDERNVEVEVAVVEVFDHFIPNDDAEFFDVDHKTRHRVGPSFDGDVQGIVVSVPVFVGAFAECGEVLFFRPGFDPELVGSVETFDTSDVNHVLQVQKYDPEQYSTVFGSHTA